MAHSFSYLAYHLVFSTRERRPLIRDAWQSDLYNYIGGIILNLDGKMLATGGVNDHVHLLVRLNASTAIADAVRIIKSNSSKWIHEKYPADHAFGWQIGYGAFSVSRSAVDAVTKYIDGQKEHHRALSFQEEFVTLLKRHGIEYDERYIWE